MKKLFDEIYKYVKDNNFSEIRINENIITIYLFNYINGEDEKISYMIEEIGEER